MIHYSIFGLNVGSEIPIPGMLPGNNSSPDITVCIGQVPDTLDDVKDSGVCYQANRKQVLLTISGVGSILIQGGRKVTVEPHTGYDQDLLKLVLLNDVFGLVLQQMKYCVFQACAVLLQNRCFAFAGSTGAGKSTLMAAFHQKGFQVVSDEICALRLAEESLPFVLVGYPFIQVWKKSLVELGVDLGQCTRTRAGLEKYTLPVKPTTATHQLECIFILSRSRHQKKSVFEQLSPSDGLIALIANTFQQQYLKGMGLLPTLLPRYSAICQAVPVVQLNMANSFNEVGSLIERIKRREFLNPIHRGL